jgi:cyclopropane-fatty-acyl-phospholipid synthase
MSLRNPFLGRLRDRLADEPPPLRIRFWDGEVFHFSPAPRVTITLHTRRLMRFFLTGNMGRLARAYVEGEIEVDGSLKDTLQIGIRLAERLGRSILLRRLARLAPPSPQQSTGCGGHPVSL